MNTPPDIWPFDDPSYPHAVARCDSHGDLLACNARFRSLWEASGAQDIFELVHEEIFEAFQGRWIRDVIRGGEAITMLGACDHQAEVIYRWEVTPLAGSEVLVQLTHVERELVALHASQPDLYSRVAPRDVAGIESSRAEWKSLMSVAAHDLKAPIRRIITFADVMGMGGEGELSDEQRSHLGIISRNAGEMQHLLHAMLDYLRLDAQDYQIESFSTGELLDPLLRSLSQPEGTFLLPERDHQVTARREMVRGLLQELLRNAVNARSPERPLRVQIEITDQKGDLLRWSIKDNGVGVKPEHRASIFEPFKRISTASAKAGFGLGLAMSAKLARQLGGEIGMRENEDGEGTTFWFTLPRVTR